MNFKTGCLLFFATMSVLLMWEKLEKLGGDPRVSFEIPSGCLLDYVERTQSGWTGEIKVDNKLYEATWSNDGDILDVRTLPEFVGLEIDKTCQVNLSSLVLFD